MIRRLLQRLLRALRGADAARPPAVLAAPRWGWPLDPRARGLEPGPADLLAELRGTAWACASLNAAACASHPPRLYVVTRHGQSAPRCLTRSLAPAEIKRLRAGAEAWTRGAERVEEVTEHPLLDLLRRVNPQHNSLHLSTNTPALSA